MTMQPSKIKSVRRYGRITAGLAGLVLIIVWAGNACTSKVRPGTEAYLPGQPFSGDAPIATAIVSRTAARVFVVGTAASEEQINLSARLPAYVNEVHVSAGDRVTKGQVLVVLDDREIREQLAAAEAQLKQAETEYQRARQLFDSKATTEQALTAAESGFNAARARMEQVKVMLTYAQITSPIDGIVTERRIEAGALANPGQVLVNVYDPTRMRLEAPVPVRLVDRLQLGQDVEVLLDYPPRFFKGRVTEIVSEIDASSRTRKVKIHLADAGNNVLPGTFGRLWVSDEERNTILIPSSSVYQVGQLELVHVVRDGRVVRRLVKTGPATATDVEILSGLDNGEIVLLHPLKGG